MRAAIYVRVSTSRQAERDLSLPDQVAQCRAYCDRRDWEVAEVFSEPGASALDDDRPAFQEMIAKATRPEKPFRFVVVHSLSRFSRDTLHSELYIRRLAKAGVQLVSITQDVGTDASGEFIRKILSVFDEHQSRENAKHVHRAMLENARQGFWNGSKPPFGYGLTITERRGNRDKKVLVIDGAEARIVRTIFDMAMGKNGHPGRRQGHRRSSQRARLYAPRSSLQHGLHPRHPDHHDLSWPALVQPLRQPQPRPETALAMGRHGCTRHHRRDGLPRRSGSVAEPRSAPSAAASRQRSNLARRHRPLRSLRRSVDPEYRQGRGLPLLLLLILAEARADGL